VELKLHANASEVRLRGLWSRRRSTWPWLARGFNLARARNRVFLMCARLPMRTVIAGETPAIPDAPPFDVGGSPDPHTTPTEGLKFGSQQNS
jgi:hypothetical protein